MSDTMEIAVPMLPHNDLPGIHSDEPVYVGDIGLISVGEVFVMVEIIALFPILVSWGDIVAEVDKSSILVASKSGFNKIAGCLIGRSFATIDDAVAEANKYKEVES